MTSSREWCAIRSSSCEFFLGGTRLPAAFVVDPNTGQARQVSLTPRRADGEVDYGPDRSSELAANLNRVQQLLNTPGLDSAADQPAMLANMPGS
jgi:hypothetical protein